MSDQKLIFERSASGKCGFLLPQSDIPQLDPKDFVDEKGIRAEDPEWAEVSEVDVIRHYTELSERNHGVDSGFYPLGSCTMKYNPKINEEIAKLDGFQQIHPLIPEMYCQGSLNMLFELESALCELTGMDRFTLHPAAGAHGEFAAMLIIKAYHRHCGNNNRSQVLVPTSAHGTNPASAAMAGFDIVQVKCNEEGLVDLEDLKAKLNPKVAALMLTNPNTLGLFEKEIATIAQLVHASGGLLYYDGANLNAIMGLVRPGDMGFDLVHLNLHKTFATPHGGGGPGAGPVGVKAFLAEYLPVPVLKKVGENVYWDEELPHSIGKIHSFYGNFIVLLKALIYIKAMGGPGLVQVSRDAVLNANYLRIKLGEFFHIPYHRACFHEFVLSADSFKEKGVRALDIAKRLIDFGIHPPTIYFPLIVEEAMMIEPTETEGKDTLDFFVEKMIQITKEIRISPEKLLEAPQNTPVRRVDETMAARKPILRWRLS